MKSCRIKRVAALLVSALWAWSAAAQPARTFDVRRYGAAGDGKTLDTRALNDAIRAAQAAGGGTVYVPPGTYLTGTVLLQSNITLYLDNGAVLLGSKNLADYQSTRGAEGPKFLGVGNEHWYQSLVQAKGVHNVAIVGHGTIDGNFLVFNINGEGRMRGPHALLIDDARDVTLRDITVRNGSNYNILLIFVQDLNCDNLTVRGGWDGIHLRDVKNATISNCRFHTGDDGIAGWNFKNVTISNCVLNSACNAFRVGGQDVLINNCMIYAPAESDDPKSHRHNTETGFLLMDSRVEDPRCVLDQTRPLNDNIVLSNVSMINVRSPLWLSTGQHGLGRFRVNNLTAVNTGRAAFYASGNPSAIESLALENVRLTTIGGVSGKMTDSQPIERLATMPAYGFYVRNVKHIEMHDVRVDFRDRDLRPAFYAKNVGMLELDRFAAKRDEAGAPSLLLEGVSRLLIDGKPLPPTEAQTTSLTVENHPVIAGETFAITAIVKNLGPAGLAGVSLQMGSERLSRTVWLQPNETGALRFVHLIIKAPGAITARSGDQVKQIVVSPKPAGGPVGSPYREFKNNVAQIEQLTDGFYIKAHSDYVDIQRADQYGAVYLPHTLSREGAVVVKVENPDMPMGTGGAGSDGIMVRNDISKAGQSTGYVLLAVHPTNGYLMQWDSNGDGMIDAHTEFDGYTTWPVWLKLVRNKSKFTGYYSNDGTTWNKVGEVEVPGCQELQDAGLFAHGSSARFRGLKVTK